MLTIESNIVEVTQPSDAVFEFLSNLNNLEKLMPHGKIEKWQSTENTCRFAIKNLGTIGMKIKATDRPNSIDLISDGKNPFPFSLSVKITGNATNTNAFFIFDGDVNMFMKAMVQSPLKQFFDALAKNLTKAMAS